MPQNQNYITYDGMVIEQTPYSENDRINTFYTSSAVNTSGSWYSSAATITTTTAAPATSYVFHYNPISITNRISPEIAVDTIDPLSIFFDEQHEPEPDELTASAEDLDECDSPELDDFLDSFKVVHEEVQTQNA